MVWLAVATGVVPDQAKGQINMRSLVIVFSLLFAALLLCTGAGEFFFLKGQADKNAGFIKQAQQLNPLVSDYFYEEYRLTGHINALHQAIRLEPTKPQYHMYYGLAVLKPLPRTRAGDQLAVTEICLAAALKPYSKAYAQACARYSTAIASAVP